MRSRASARWLVATALCCLVPPTVSLRADDRLLLGTTGSDPYVFVLFDISGSMNWRPGGDFWAPANGDDVTSKLYNAKSALFEVISDPDLADLRWGFATYNQDQVQVFRKHWVYTPVTSPPWVDGFLGLPYPVAGQAKMFGDDCFWSPNRGRCDLDLEDDDIHATCNNPFDLTDPAELGQLKSFPVTGDQGNEISEEWIVWSGTTYRVRWELTSGNLGDDSITVQVNLAPKSVFRSCPNVGFFQSTATLEMVRLQDTDLQGNPLAGATQTLFWQDSSFTDINGAPNGFLDPDDLRAASGSCLGWEANDDSFRDNGSDVTLKYITSSDPLGRGAPFDRGDVVPLDWQDETAWGLSNRDAILGRLAPDYDPSDACPPDEPDCQEIVPDFRAAPYFEDHPDNLRGGRLALRGEFVDTPPLLPSGATPLGNSMSDFLDWYDLWRPVAAAAETGDPLFSCRAVNLVIITDGDETCYTDDDGDPATGQLDALGNANPCWIADRLRNESGREIKSYVIGFGLQGSDANFLSCMADNGGTGAADGGPGVILPQNREELVEALKRVLLEIQSDAASFASAAVPTVQVGVDDKIFLSSFRPVPILEDSPQEGCGEPLPQHVSSIWEGHLNAYLRPLPLDAEGQADDSVSCAPDADVAAACHLWDIADAMLVQAPTAGEVEGCSPDNTAACRVGRGANERRVYFGLDPMLSQSESEVDDLPRAVRYLEPFSRLRTDDGDGTDLTEDELQWEDLVTGMGIYGDECAQEKAERAVRYLLAQKEATLDTPDGPEDTVYILGDIFHSRPVLFGAPSRSDYFSLNLGGGDSPPSDKASCLEDRKDVAADDWNSYLCFWERHEHRRKMVLVGTNDDQIHAFDAGRWDPVAGEFSNGTGQEIFSFVPRALLPRLVSLAETPQHRWGADGTIRVDDVFIDPLHTGEPNRESEPVSGRQWRTVAVAGLRRGGSAYVALDITQPDELAPQSKDPVLDTDAVASCPEPDGWEPPMDTDPSRVCDLPFPALLWEFTDPTDEDSNAGATDPGLDLAQAWSTPATGRIRTCPGGGDCDVFEDRYVAIFGGGLDVDFWVKRTDPLNAAVPNGGWLYMVDIETGKILYKRSLAGSAPSEPAAVDTDLDGYLDRIYIGTTDGLLYKVDISQPMPLEGPQPGDSWLGERIVDPAWEPFAIFESVDDRGFGRPIFFPPSVIFVGRLGKFALAFGTGDREDLWSEHGQDGRFYMLLDDNYTPSDTLPVTESDLVGIDPATDNTSIDYLFDPSSGGWYLRLDAEERVITKPFALSGVTVFSAYKPNTFVLDPEAPASCAQRGESRIFTVFTTSGDGVVTENGSRTRFWTVDDFVTDPYTELSVTKNENPGADVDPLSADLQEVMETLRSLYPENCQFANYTINLKTLRSDTGIFFIAPIPVCLIEKNWREQ